PTAQPAACGAARPPRARPGHLPRGPATCHAARPRRAQPVRLPRSRAKRFPAPHKYGYHAIFRARRRAPQIIADTDQENCQKRGAAANRYAGMQNGPVTAGGDGPGQGVMGVCWSGSLVVCGDGDGYAECFELADVVADLLVLAGAVAVVVLAEVAVAGPGVGEQVPDDDHDGAGDGGLGDGLAAAAGYAPVPFAEEGV